MKSFPFLLTTVSVVVATATHTVPLFGGAGSATFEAPMVLHSSPFNHTWFTKLHRTGTADHLVAVMSMHADSAKPCVPTPIWPCGWSASSLDGGRTWAPMPAAGALAAVTPPNASGHFFGLAYTQHVAADNRSATSTGTVWLDDGASVRVAGSAAVTFGGFGDAAAGAPPLPPRLVVRGQLRIHAVVRRPKRHRPRQVRLGHVLDLRTQRRVRRLSPVLSEQQREDVRARRDIRAVCRLRHVRDPGSAQPSRQRHLSRRRFSFCV